MQVSREEIERHKTANGGYTRETLAMWGVPWPPKKGRKDGGKCVLCGRSVADGVKLQVDHIKPSSLYPELALDPINCRTTCSDCNIGKADGAA